MESVMDEIFRKLKSVPGLKPPRLVDGSKIQLSPYRRKVLPFLIAQMIPIAVCVFLAYIVDWVPADVVLGVAGIIFGFFWTNYLLLFFFGERFTRLVFHPKEILLFDRLSASRTKIDDITDLLFTSKNMVLYKLYYIIIESNQVINANLLDILFSRSPKIPVHWFLLGPEQNMLAFHEVLKSIVTEQKK